MCRVISWARGLAGYDVALTWRRPWVRISSGPPTYNRKIKLVFKYFNVLKRRYYLLAWVKNLMWLTLFCHIVLHLIWMTQFYKWCCIADRWENCIVRFKKSYNHTNCFNIDMHGNGHNFRNGPEREGCCSKDSSDASTDHRTYNRSNDRTDYSAHYRTDHRPHDSADSSAYSGIRCKRPGKQREYNLKLKT